MAIDQTLPDLWLLSDARNDAVLEVALAALPRGSAFVFRHYHLEPEARRERFAALAAICRARCHMLVLSGTARQASDWGAEGAYGPAGKLGRAAGIARFATTHNLPEMHRAERCEVDAMFLSPVFPTRSHPGGACLGKEAFLALAAQASKPVIALGGMTAGRAVELGWPRWAAIDGLS